MTPDRLRELAAAVNTEVGDPMSASTMELNEAAAALRAYADLLERTRWIPVTERNPDKRGYYLVWGNRESMDTVGIAKWEAGFWWQARNDEHDPSHWMPLPDPPEALDP